MTIHIPDFLWVGDNSRETSYMLILYIFQLVAAEHSRGMDGMVTHYAD